MNVADLFRCRTIKGRVPFGLAVMAVAACADPDQVNRREILFQGFDQVSTPAREIELAVSLRTAGFTRPLTDYTVFFFVTDGSGRRRIGAAKTNADGIARIAQRFESLGLHTVTAELDPAELHSARVPSCELLVAVFESTQRFVVVDLDHTVVDAGLDEVLLGDPDPLPDAAAVLTDLARQQHVLYLTHRPEFLRSRSKRFLKKWGFPEGPLLMCTLDEWASGSESFKTGELDRLLALFPNITLGVGDRISDGVAYRGNGLDCFIIVQPQKLTAAQRVVLADQLEVLDDQAQVVTSWDQIRAVLAGTARYPRSAMQRQLRGVPHP